MEHPVKAPAVGESITEVRILKWKKSDGEAVNPGDILVEIETDKATVEVASETKGALQIIAKEGETVTIGALIAKVDDSKAGTAGAATSAVKSPTPSASAAIPASAGNLSHSAPLSPAVRRMAEESGVDISKMSPGEGKAGRLTKGDLLREISTRGSGGKSSGESGQKILQSIGESLGVLQPQSDRPGDRRVAMSRLRLKIAERLVQAQHTAAILTTFNEVDMNPVQVMRNKNKEAFKAKHGVALSFMSFFTKASQIALKAIPEINASIQGKDIVYHDYYDIGIAVGTERGLVVPVLRGVEKMGFVDIEKGIGVLAAKARDNKLTLSDMDGGTFTISNGGTYGSLMSTPILNPPQSGILGMHKIMDRPVAIDGKVEIRPMMYIALSYDHRIVDGKGAVTFLVTLKDLLEHPEKLGFDF